jgi:hypothetical protein
MTTAATVSVRLDLISKQFEQGLDDAKKKAQDFSKSIESAGRTMRNVGAGMTAAFTAPMVAMGVKAAMTAGRVDELDLVVRTLGKNAGYAEKEIDAHVESVRKMGIEAGASREIIAKFVTAQIDAADASKIARIAQDQAVITGMNSTETTMRLTDAIIQGRQQTFRSMMMNVNLEDSYKQLADTMGKHVDELTEAELVQARVNAVVEYGATVTGTYEASMESGTKQLRSYKRYIDDIFVAVGEYLTPAFNDLVFTGKDVLAWIKDLVSEGGALEPVLDGWGSALESVVGYLKSFLDVLMGLPPWMLQLGANLAGILAVSGPLLLVAGQAIITLPKLSAALSAVGISSWAALGPLAAVGVAIAGVVTIVQNNTKKINEQADAYNNVREAALAAGMSYEEYRKALEKSTEEQGNASNGYRAYRAEMKDTKAELDRLRESLLITEEEYNIMHYILKNGQGIYEDEVMYLEEVSGWVYEAGQRYKDWHVLINEGTEDLSEYFELVDGEWIPVQIRAAEVTSNLSDVTWEQALALRGLSEEYTNLPTEPAEMYVDLDTQAALESLDELKAKFEQDLVHAMESLSTAQNSWKTSVADDLVKGLEEAGVTGDELVERLEAIDEAFGTQLAMEHRYEVEYELLMPELLQTLLETPEVFAERASAFKDYMMPLEVSIINATEKVEEIQGKLDEIAKEYDAIFNFMLEDPEGLYDWEPPGNTTSTHTYIFEYVGERPEYRAIGGSVMARTPYIVGERGPELFVPDVSGEIVPNNAITNNYNLSMPTTADPTDVGMAFELLEAYGGN